VYVQVLPLDFSDLFEDVTIDYDDDDTELTYQNEHTQEATLTINSPIAIIGALGISPSEDNIQEYSFNFGFLITSETEVNVSSDVPLAPGDRFDLDIEASEGTPGSTYGLALHESWIDLNSFDVGTFTAFAFAEAWAEMIELEPGMVADSMNSVVYGEDETGFADIPAAIWDEDIVLITITDVENGGIHALGVYIGDAQKPEPIILDMSFEVLTADPIVNDTIEMKMTDEDGDPLAGVTLHITLDGEDVIDVVTDADGEASFEVEDGGTYHVNASKDGYTSVEDDIVVRGEDDPEERLQINLPGGDLIEDEVLTFTVVDKDTGLAVNGAGVTILSGSVIIDTAFTNLVGQVSFTLSAGQYTVRAEKTDYTKDERTIVVAEEEEPGEDDGVIPGFESAFVALSLLGVAMIFRRRS